MSKAGLTAPATWTELLAFCRAAKEKGTPAFALGIQDNWVTQLVAVRRWPPRSSTARTGTSRRRWRPARRTFAELAVGGRDREVPARWTQTGCFQENPLGTSYEASQKLAATGKTLGIIQGNWVISLLKKQNPSGTFTLKPLPATDDPAQTIIPAAAGAGYGVNAKAKNPELAMKFISFVMSPAGHEPVRRQAGRPAGPRRTPVTSSTRR